MDRIKFNGWLERRGLSAVTKKHYLYFFDRFKGIEFNQEAVNNFMNDIKNFESKTIPMAFLRNYLNFLIETYPMETEFQRIRVPRNTGRKARKLPTFPSEEDIKRIEPFMLSERDKLMLLLSFYSALRPHGLIHLELQNFDWPSYLKDETKPVQLRVTEKGRKERIVFVKPEIMKRLRVWAKDNARPKEYLWKIGYYRWFKLLTEASKKALGRSISPHKLRHGGATWLLRKGWTLQELSEFLGHESISTTQIYAHLDKDKMMDKYAEL